MSASVTSDRAEPTTSLRERSLRLGDFTLSSGQTSHFYVDARTTTMSSTGMHPIALASRSIPPVMDDAFTVRKEPKGHGAGRRIEGCYTAGSPVVVVEDVITSGGSALTAARAVHEAGGKVVGILAVVDRMEGGREAMEEAGYDLRAMLAVRDLGVDPGAREG